MLDSVEYLPDGTKMLVEGEAQDTVRRLRDGDSALGWEGDPNIKVFVVNDPTDPHDGMFEVWTLDRAGLPYCALVSRSMGAQIVLELMAHDGRRVDVFAEVEKKNRKKIEDAERALRERNEEIADKLHFALLKENGHHLGGLTKRVL